MFPRTARSLAGQSSLGARLTLASAIALLGAWGYWFTHAKVPIYETSDQARIEVLRATHPIDASAGGRVVAMNLTLEATVVEGDVLVELDAEPERLQLAEARAKAVGIAPQITAIRAQVAAETRALGVFRQQLGSTVAVAESQLHEGEIVARAGGVEAERSKRLFAERAVPEAEVTRAQTEAERRLAAQAALAATVERLWRESATGEGDRQARLAMLERDAAHFEAELVSLAATIQSLEHAIDRRTIRAPAAGRIGEVGNVRIGSVLAPGEHIATVVAGGDLRVVASFSPASALGRVHPGQRARVRLDGFPWTEYGVIEASVTQVASELRDGQARIELAVDMSAPTRVPLQHGLPGTVEVTVEEVTPATLVLRAAGRFGTRPAQAATVGSTAR